MLVHNIKHFSLDQIVRDNPATTNYVLLDTLHPTSPPSRSPSYVVDTVVNNANKTVNKLVIVVQLHNPCDLELTSACLSSDGTAIVVSHPDHGYLVLNREGMAGVIGGDNTNESNAFITSLTTCYGQAPSHAPSTDTDILIPMTDTTVLLPTGVVGSNSYFNDGDYDMIICFANTLMIVSPLCPLLFLLFLLVREERSI